MRFRVCGSLSITQILAMERPFPDVTVRPKHHVGTGQTDWRNAMRSGLALFLLIALCASASAATRARHANSRYVIVRPNQAVLPGYGNPAYGSPAYVTPNGARVFRDDSAPGGFRTDGDPPVSYDDPSKYGGSP